MIKVFSNSLGLLAILLLCQLCANSQKNLKVAFVVLKNGDSLRGEIDYRGWEKNPLKVHFRQPGIITEYTPADLASFEVDGVGMYESWVVVKDIRPVDIHTLTTRFIVNDSSVTDTVFLRRLVNGTRIRLYQLVDSKEHYFIQQVALEPPRELVYKKYIDEKDGRIHEENQFKNQLAAFIAGVDDPENTLATITRSRYEEANLINLVSLLNGGKLVKYRSSIPAKRSTPVFIMAGAGLTWVNFRFTGDLDKWTRLRFPGSIGTSAVIAVDFSGQRNLGLRLGLSYSHLSYNGAAETNDLLSRPSRYKYKLVQNSLLPEFTLIHHFIRKEDFRLYAGLGVGFMLSSYPVNEYHTTIISTGEEEVEYNLLEPVKFWLSPNFMAGARFWNKLNLTITTKVFGGFIDYSRVGANQFPVNFTAAYSFYSKK